MGKSGRKDSEQLREYRLRLEKEAKEKKKRQNRIVYGTLGGFLGVILIAVAVTLIVTQAGKRKAPKMSQIDLSDVSDASVFTVSETETDYVRLSVSYTTAEGLEESGDIYIRLFPDVAPKTVENFKSLVASGFYSGKTFHRVFPGFMIQGGGDGAASIAGEFESNGFENNLKHCAACFPWRAPACPTPPAASSSSCMRMRPIWTAATPPSAR